MRNKKNARRYSLLAPIFILICSLLIEIFPIRMAYADNISINSLSSLDSIGNVKEDAIKNQNDSISSDIKKLEVYVGGTPIGIKISTDGLLVVAFSDIESLDGKTISPAAEKGIAVGDSIIEANGIKLKSSQELIKIVNSERGKEIKLTIKRNGALIEKSVTPIKCLGDGKYKIGLWLRDSTAGVGTLTFYDKNTDKFAALGHPITDNDTNTIINISKGNIVKSSIINVKKGMRGNPGELKGIFLDEDLSLGEIVKNTQCGIFGYGRNSISNIVRKYPMKVASRGEIKEGPAKIITTIDEEGPKEYEINIDKLLNQSEPGPKSMVIRITDEELLNKTGGIIQGMSGSPIIQNDKLVGAVTHVLINKPDTGYGVYIEWMMEDAGILLK